MSDLRKGHVVGVVAENPRHAQGENRKAGLDGLYDPYITTVAVHEPVEAPWFTEALEDIGTRLVDFASEDPIWQGRSSIALKHMGTATVRLGDKDTEATIVTLRSNDKGCDISTGSMRPEDVTVARAEWAEQHNVRLNQAAERLAELVTDAANMYQDAESAQRHLAFLGHVAIPAPAPSQHA